MKDELAKADSLVDASSLTSAAASVAENNTFTAEEGEAALEENGVTVNEGETVTIVVQPYMDIAITDVTINEDGSKTLTLDITPMYRTVATTATSTSDIELGTNAVEVNAEELAISESVVMTIPLPTGYAADGNLYVNHVKDGHTYVYTGNVVGNVLTFTNPHGFSEFTITSVEPVAKIGDVGFTSLQDAVNAANTGDTIELMVDGLSAVVSREVSFKVEMHGYSVNLTAGSDYTMSVSEDGTYTFTRTGGGSSSGGGGGSS